MPESVDVEPKTMSIGINNVFEVGCGILLQIMSSPLIVINYIY